MTKSKIQNKSKIPRSKSKFGFGILKLGFVLIFALWILIFFSYAYVEYPKRIVSTMPSITEMLFALGLEDQIVGVTTNCNYPLEALEKEKVGGFFLNLEKVVSLKPDLIVMLEDAQKGDLQNTVDPQTVIEVMGTLVELGEVTGTKEKAEEVVEGMKKRILSVEAKVSELPLKKVLIIVGYKPLIVVGGENFIDDVIRYAGAGNIAADTKAAYPQYSFEKLLDDDPDHIIIPEGVVEKKEIEGDSRWQSLEAVKNDRLLFIDADILSRPGPRVVEAIEEIAEFIHEEETQ
jgi:iron complex transport system substrate-binding protein